MRRTYRVQSPPALPHTVPSPHRLSLGEVRWEAAGSAVTACVCVRARGGKCGPRCLSRLLPGPSRARLLSSPRDLTFPTAVACVPVRLPGTATDPFPSSFPSSAPASVGSFSPPFPPGSLWGREGEERFVFNYYRYSEGRKNKGTKGNPKAIYFKPLLL